MKNQEILDFLVNLSIPGGAVGLKEMLHLYDVRVLEAGHHPGFVQEPVQAPVKVRLVPGGLGQDRHVLLAHSQVRGQVFLDGHRDVQGNFPAEIGDAEAAVAQDPVELEVLYPGALRQGQAVVGGGHGEVSRLVLDMVIIPDCGS